jgi:tRNA nucleotidyltransferase (CCA-adding enzyme)
VDRLWGVPQPPEHHPEIDTGVHLMRVLDQCARCWRCPAAGALGLRWCTTWARAPRRANNGRAIWATKRRSARYWPGRLADRLRVPTECRELADVVAREHGQRARAVAAWTPRRVLRLFERCDALRRPARFADKSCRPANATARGRSEGREWRALCAGGCACRALLQAALAVDTAVGGGRRRGSAVARGPAIGEAVHEARTGGGVRRCCRSPVCDTMRAGRGMPAESEGT